MYYNNNNKFILNFKLVSKTKNLNKYKKWFVSKIAVQLVEETKVHT